MSDESTIATRNFQPALAKTERDACGKPAALLVVAGELSGTLFDLDRDPISIGRSDQASIQLEFAGISRKHLLLEANGDRITLHDTGSKNGTFVNDSRIDSTVVLQKGDLIRLGPVVLKYLPKGDPERIAFDTLNHKANIDAFTGCFSKAYFNGKIELEVRKCRLNGGKLSLIVLDLDHFKSLNDRYGHDAGDSVLKALAQLVRASGLRKNDVFARYGGEEFVVLLPQTTVQECEEIAERLRLKVASHPFHYDGLRLIVTVSIGVAEYAEEVGTGVELFRRADSALYHAKHSGRNRVQVYHA